MTPDERTLLTDLADKIAQTPAPARDKEAEELIRTRIGSRPDALYLMTQTVLIQNLALEHAQQQIQELQQRDLQQRDLQQRSTAPAPVAGGSSFLGQQPPAARNVPYTAPAPTQAYAANPSGAPSFLRGAAQTAAGVAAGALAFEGIRALFSHPGYGGGFGGFGGGGFLGGGGPGGETIVNNYYDSPQDTAAADSTANDMQNVDDSGQYDDSAQYEDASNYDTGDVGGFDDSSGGDSFV